jgi:UDP-2,4-diacetamido-2,4,6-trideoxy-beta-L-altropyranose hydrolase
MAPLVVARFDAGAGLGLGHLVRCHALLDLLAGLGWVRAVAVNAEGTAFLPDRGTATLVVGDDDAAQMRARWPDGCDLVIVDHYRRDAGFERALRGWARRVLVIDDLADRPHDADLLLDQTPGRNAADYGRLIGPATRGLFGGEHALLRPQFQAARRVALARRDGRAVDRIAIAFGGSDPDDWTSRAIGALAACGFSGALDVVLGAAAPHGDRVAAALAPFGDRALLHRDVADMAGLLARADLAIGAAGVSSWERCALGLPALAIVIADNQRACAAALARSGAAAISDAASLESDLARLLDQPATRVTMAAAGASLCDGRGLQRVALALLPSLPVRGGIVSLRLAEPADSDLMLAWQSLAEVRRYARNPAMPTPEGHAAWLAGVLADPGRWLMLIELDGRPCGVLRLDHLEDGRFEVSILVDPAMQGRGLALAALKLAQGLSAGIDILAEVDPANAASQAVFRNAGFQPTDARHWLWRGTS